MYISTPPRPAPALSTVTPEASDQNNKLCPEQHLRTALLSRHAKVPRKRTKCTEVHQDRKGGVALTKATG